MGGHSTPLRALRIIRERGDVLYFLGASDSQGDRVNVCMRARQKYINNYTTKQYTAGSEWREVGRIQVEG